MPLFQDRRDFYFTSEGDFFLSEAGDFEDTQNHQYRALIQQILTRLMSTRGDWPLQPTVGANLGEFLGAANTAQTGQLIRARILSELSREALLNPQDMKVDVVPVSRNAVMILLVIVPPGSTQAVYLNFTYNLSENKLVPRNL